VKLGITRRDVLATAAGAGLVVGIEAVTGGLRGAFDSMGTFLREDYLRNKYDFKPKVVGPFDLSVILNSSSVIVDQKNERVIAYDKGLFDRPSRDCTTQSANLDSRPVETLLGGAVFPITTDVKLAPHRDGLKLEDSFGETSQEFIVPIEEGSFTTVSKGRINLASGNSTPALIFVSTRGDEDFKVQVFVRKKDGTAELRSTANDNPALANLDVFKIHADYTRELARYESGAGYRYSQEKAYRLMEQASDLQCALPIKYHRSAIEAYEKALAQEKQDLSGL
jgi:hypothetical protein